MRSVAIGDEKGWYYRDGSLYQINDSNVIMEMVHASSNVKKSKSIITGSSIFLGRVYSIELLFYVIYICPVETE